VLTAQTAPAVPVARHVEGDRALRALGLALPPVLALYALFDKGFAYIHIPRTPVFPGEVVVGLALLVVVVATTYVRRGVRRAWSMPFLGLFVAWGAVRLLPEVQVYGLDSVRDSALWYYALVAVGVVALCAAWPDLPERWARWYGFLIPVLLVWSILALGLLRQASPHIPDSQVSAFSHGPGNIAVQVTIAMSFLWLVPMRSALSRYRVALLALGVTLLLVVGTQNRGGLVAAIIGLGLCLVLGRDRLRLFGALVGAIALLLVVAWAADVHIPGGQGREVSTAQLAQNIGSLTGGGGTQGALANNVAWRDQLWAAAVSKTVARGQVLDGWGFGPNIAQALGFQGSENPPLRSPHNSHVDVFTRMGLIGIILWVLFWLTWFAHMLRARTRLRGPGDQVRCALLGVILVGVTATLVNAYFDPTLETPMVAIWLWTLVGLGVGLAVPAMARRDPTPARRDQVSPITAPGRRGAWSQAMMETGTEATAAPAAID
jgi:O-antigen ligase